MLGSVVPKASTRRLMVSIEAWMAEVMRCAKPGIGDRSSVMPVVALAGDVEVVAGEAREHVAADRRGELASAAVIGLVHVGRARGSSPRPSALATILGEVGIADAGACATSRAHRRE